MEVYLSRKVVDLETRPEKVLMPRAAASPHLLAREILAESTDSTAFSRTTMHDDPIRARRERLSGRATSGVSQKFTGKVNPLRVTNRT